MGGYKKKLSVFRCHQFCLQKIIRFKLRQIGSIKLLRSKQVLYRPRPPQLVFETPVPTTPPKSPNAPHRRESPASASNAEWTSVLVKGSEFREGATWSTDEQDEWPGDGWHLGGDLAEGQWWVYGARMNAMCESRWREGGVGGRIESDLGDDCRD